MLLKYPVSSLSILTNDVLNSASDRLLISISFSSCFWNFVLFFHLGYIYLCFLILAASLCLFWCIRLNCLTHCLSNMAYYRKVHLQVRWSGASGNSLGGATWVTSLLLCVGEYSERRLYGFLASGVFPRRKLPPHSHCTFSPMQLVPFQLLPRCGLPEGVGLHES